MVQLEGGIHAVRENFEDDEVMRLIPLQEKRDTLNKLNIHLGQRDKHTIYYCTR